MPPSTDDVALRLSIEDLGTLEPITLYERKVLDGRARLRVNQQLGRSVEVEHFEDTDIGKAAAAQGKGALDDAALAYVFDKNLVRRHLTDTQRAVLAFRRANMRQGERTDLLEPSAAWRKVSQADAAERFQVSERSVSRVGYIYQHGTKDEIAGMEAEKIGLEPLVREIKRRERKRQAELQRLSCPSISPDTVSLICGNCRTVLGNYPDNYFDACICDPPYGINIAGWDRQVPPLEDWQGIFRVLKPGGFCTAFASPRLYHRLASLIEQGGFEIKDMVQWIVSYKMAKINNLRPAHEPICIAQKPYERSLEYNADKWGTGFANIEDARIPWDGSTGRHTIVDNGREIGWVDMSTQEFHPNGRYPANVVGYLDERLEKYFYSPRVTPEEKRYYNDHPCAKPIALMAWLLRLYSPPIGKVLDPYMGSGTTGVATLQEGRRFVGIDRDQEFVDIARRRIDEQTAARSGHVRGLGIPG